MMKLLFKYFPYDKSLHFVAGNTIFALLHFVSIPVALVGVVVAAIGKEIYDHYHPDHSFDWMDAVWTIAGGVIGLVAYL